MEDLKSRKGTALSMNGFIPTENRLSFAIRMGLSVMLVAIVWAHSHWSAALSITLLAVANEVNVWHLRVLSVTQEALDATDRPR